MTILNTEIVNYFSTGAIITIFVALVSIAVSIVTMVNSYDFDCHVIGTIIIIFSIGLLLIGFFIVPKEQYTKYEVLLNEEYSAKEFIENYEFIEQHGDIYILRDKQ